MRGICSIGLVLAVVVAFAPDASAQERGGSSSGSTKTKTKTKTTTKHKHRSKKSGPTVEIDIRSTPRGASIYVDGDRVGRAPLKARVATGSRTIEARASGYANARTSIDVTSKMGYLVFSLAREAEAPKVAKSDPPRRSAKASSISYDDAIVKARMSLKRADHSDALKYAEAALSHKSSDSEAKMIATIAACGVGDKSLAKQHLPSRRGSYREIAIKRCNGLGIQLP